MRCRRVDRVGESVVGGQENGDAAIFCCFPINDFLFEFRLKTMDRAR